MKRTNKIQQILNNEDFKPSSELKDRTFIEIINMLEELVDDKVTLKAILDDEIMSENLYEFISYLILYNQSKKIKKDKSDETYKISSNTFSAKFSNVILYQ